MKLKTAGIAPKTIVATALPLVAGIALALIDKLAASDSIDDSIWWTLIGSSPLLGGGTYVAPAAPVAKVRARKREAGYAFIELIVGALLFLVFLVFCVWVLRALL